MLKIKDLHVNVNGTKILKGVNLRVKSGDVHIILGLNGSGKTTLAYTIIGLKDYKVVKGDILLNNKKINNLSITERARRGITLGWQQPAMFKGITVSDYLRLNTKDEDEIREMVSLVGLNYDKYKNKQLEYLSGGERKRIELVSVLLFKPKLAILDEPDSGIDFVSLKKIIRVIKKFRDLKKTTFILITHSEKVADIGDTASLMCGGIIFKTGKPKDIKRFFRDQCKECVVRNPIIRNKYKDRYKK